MTEPEEPIRAPWPPAQVYTDVEDPYIRPEERLRDEAQPEEE